MRLYTEWNLLVVDMGAGVKLFFERDSLLTTLGYPFVDTFLAVLEGDSEDEDALSSEGLSLSVIALMISEMRASFVSAV